MGFLPCVKDCSGNHWVKVVGFIRKGTWILAFDVSSYNCSVKPGDAAKAAANAQKIN